MTDDLKKLAEAAPMSDVEKVARAIAAADGEDYMEDFQRYDARAKAALAAMGEREAKPRPHGEGQ